MRPRTLDEIVGQDEILAPGQAAARGDRARPAAVDHPLGTAGHRQDDARADHRRADAGALRPVQRRARRASRKSKRSWPRRRIAGAARGRRTIVFVDEIHRFNKAQQDAFLPRVEAGDIVLIGATTENPSFEVNAALLSRSKVFVLQPLTSDAVEQILRRALADTERGLGATEIERHRTRRSRRSRDSPTATRERR